MERDANEAQRRAYPFPILMDPQALLAKAFVAEYATYSVILDGNGSILYRGGIDSDRTHLRDDATFFVREALDDLLAGHPPRRPDAKTLGCALQRD